MSDVSPFGDQYTIKLKHTGEFPWPWTVWVEPPGYPHGGETSDLSLAFTKRGAERAARRIVARMERSRQKKGRTYTATAKELLS